MHGTRSFLEGEYNTQSTFSQGQHGMVYSMHKLSSSKYRNCRKALECHCSFHSLVVEQGPAKKWEEELLSLGVASSEPGIEGEEISPLAKENIATP